MPIQFPDFQRISFDEANPMLVGAERGQKFMQSAISFPQMLQAQILANQKAKVEAQYAGPMAEQALQQSQQKTQWDPKIWGSEIGLRGAQTALGNEQAKYYGPNVNSEIGLRSAQTQEARLNAQAKQQEMMWLARKLGLQNANQNTGGGVPQSSGGYTPIPSGQGGGMSMGGSSAQPSMQIPQGGSGMPSSNGQAAQMPMSNNNGVIGSQSAQPQISQPQQTSMQSPQQQSMYGVTIPEITADDIGNTKYLGIDTYTPKKTQAYENIKQQKDQYVKEIDESAKNAGNVSQSRSALNVYNKAMDNAYLTGPFFGTSPISGWQTALHPLKDYSQEQIAEQASANLIPGAMAEIKEAMGQGKFSMIDMQASQKLKSLDRTATPEARKQITKFVDGVFNRMDEKSKFYQTMYQQKLADKQTADLLWQNYQNNFPIADEKGNYKENEKGINENLNNWPLFTTPRAIASVIETGSYKPNAAERNTFMMRYKDGMTLPVKMGGVAEAFRKGAMPL